MWDRSYFIVDIFVLQNRETHHSLWPFTLMRLCYILMREFVKIVQKSFTKLTLSKVKSKRKKSTNLHSCHHIPYFNNQGSNMPLKRFAKLYLLWMWCQPQVQIPFSFLGLCFTWVLQGQGLGLGLGLNNNSRDIVMCCKMIIGSKFGCFLNPCFHN